MQQVPDEGLIDQALSLIATSEIATERAARLAASRLAAWRARTPQHETAYLEALRRWKLLGAVAPEMRERFPQDIPLAASRGMSRRTLLGLGVAGACTALLGTGWYWRQPLYRASYETDSGQLSQAQVPDRADGGGLGTRIDLSAQTRLAVSLYRHERVVELSHGEALFTVAPDAGRPFRVRTRGGEVEVVGTVFTVSDRGGAVSLAVEEGHVRFHPAPRDARWYTLARGGPSLDLWANTAVTWRDGEVEPVRRIDPESVAAWRNGWLWFDNQRLDEALPAINAFRTRPLTAASPAVNALRLTGRFRSADADSASSVLEAILPLRAETRADGDVVLRLR
ncbi:MAG: FecR family protein [Achromobacter veterisilvae]